MPSMRSKSTPRCFRSPGWGTSVTPTSSGRCRAAKRPGCPLRTSRTRCKHRVREGAQRCASARAHRPQLYSAAAVVRLSSVPVPTPRLRGAVLVVRTRRQSPELFPEVRQALEALVPKKLRRRIKPDASILADLGLDSLKVVELTMLLEKQLGRPVFLPEWIASVEDPADLTVASLSRFLAEKR